MNWNWKERSSSSFDKEGENNKQKTLFKTYYCLECKQVKPCHLLSDSKCCACYFQIEQERAKEYSSFEKVLISKQKEQAVKYKQYQLLKNYLGCSQCGGLEVDAYELYENNRLVCQPCLMRKTGRSSSPISFSEKQKWYQKRWGINLVEWLMKLQCLPVNADCAREWSETKSAEQWSKDQNHLNSCQCLEKETKKLVELFTSSLKEYQEKLAQCFCKTSKKVRVESDYSTACEKCGENIAVASKKRVIKNRNDPRFWGLEIEEKVLCLNCLGKFQKEMPISKQYTFNKYVKRYGGWRVIYLI